MQHFRKKKAGKLHNKVVTAVFNISDALEILSKSLTKRLEELEIWGSIERLLFKSAQILSRVITYWEGLAIIWSPVKASSYYWMYTTVYNNNHHNIKKCTTDLNIVQ